MNFNLDAILSILSLGLGLAQKITKSKDAQSAETIGGDLLLIAKQALAAHAELNGMTEDQVLAKLHELPPPTL